MRDIRTLPPKVGSEPINMIEVWWTDTLRKVYADRTIDQATPGQIISLSSLNDVLRLDSSGSSGSLSVVLSDLDGSLKEIYDSTDIHLRSVKVYQFFIIDDEPVGPYLLFEGGVASPIVWNEGERTLSFDIMSRVLDVDVGFAPYDGQFQNLPASKASQTWPTPFGLVELIPVVSLQEEPTGILIDPFGIPDRGIPEQIWRLQKQMLALKPEVIGTTLKPDATLDELNEALANDAQALQQALDQIQEQKNEIQDQIFEYDRTWLKQLALFKSHVKIYSMTIPAGSHIFKMDDTIFSGTVTRIDAFTADLQLHISVEMTIPDPEQFFLDEYGFPKFGRPGALQYNFRYFTSGTALQIIESFNLKYVISTVPGNVIGVYAYRSYNGLRQLAQVPQEYYAIQHGIPSFDDATAGESIVTSGVIPSTTTWLNPVIISLRGPLSTIQWKKQLQFVDMSIAPTTANLDQIYNGFHTDYYTGNVQPHEEWEDQIYVTFRSSIGPDPMQIMRWAILTFSNLGVDDTSFALGQFPWFAMNFVLMEKKPLSTFLNELAVHLCCFVYIKNEKYYLISLRSVQPPVDTITEADIEVGSLQLQCTETESIVTKYEATYRSLHYPDAPPSKIVLYNNVNKYGLRTETFDYYAFNGDFAVMASAMFWLIRKSHTWKRITFKTFLHKLNIETMDTVELDFTKVKIANDPVNGFVESAVYDSENHVIEMTVWTPIRLGDLDPYPLFWGSNVTTEIIKPFAETLFSGSGSMIPNTSYQTIKVPTPPPNPGINIISDLEKLTNEFFTRGKDRQVTITYILPRSGIPSIEGDEELETNATDIREAFPELGPSPKAVINSGRVPDVPAPGPRPGFDYTLRDFIPHPPIVAPSGGGGIPGKVIEKDEEHGDFHYIVKIYPNGIDQKGKNISVRQLQIDKDDEIKEDTWVMVSNVKGKYYMQVPVWLE